MLPLLDCRAGHASHRGQCGHRHMALGPALIQFHLYPVFPASGLALGAFEWAQSLPPQWLPSTFPWLPNQRFLFSSWLPVLSEISQGRHENHPGGSPRAPGTKSLGRLRASRRRHGGLEGRGSLEPHRSLGARATEIPSGPWCLAFRISSG